MEAVGLAPTEEKRPGKERPMQSTDWASEHSDALREYLVKGMSYSEIAEAINAKFKTAYSRNAAIGRARRMGLAGRDRAKDLPQHWPAPPAPSYSGLWRRSAEFPMATMKPLPRRPRIAPLRNEFNFHPQRRQSDVPRAKRNKPHRPTRVHDRRSQDLLRNAEVAAMEVDDPLALEPGDKIVTLRSIRNDPLAWMHTHRQIDEAQYQGGRAFQDDWEKAERGPQAVDPTREYVDGGQAREPITERQRKAVLRLNRAEGELGADGSRLA